ncbi:MAG: deoxyribodipyrimidine photo-lyase/cryptochrome family protein [Pseudomonadota bacterium]
MAGPFHIVWFKRDLRLADHPALSAAAAAARETGYGVLPLFIAEPAQWSQPDAAARHWAFAAECLAALQSALGRAGTPLLLETGPAVAVLERLRAAHGIAALWSHQETGNGWSYARDRAVAAWAAGQGIPWHEPVQSGVVRRLRSRDGWAQRFDRLMAQNMLDIPALPPLDLDPATIPTALPTAADLGLAPDACAERQPGGRGEGLALLTSFLAARARPYRRAMSAPEAGARHCSRLSPHLAWGTVSTREAVQAAMAARAAITPSDAAPDKTMRDAITSFIGRLHWRDHFTQKLEDAPKLEFHNLHPAMDGLRPEAPDAARLAAFARGETGLPFVDACLRCLSATGWMNFRMRAMLQAVASYHLWLPWRASGLVLARLFTDYEPGIHWPQTQMQSGTTGINTVRIYNPVKQGHDQDPQGAFIRRWLPELAAVPDAQIQTPWAWEGAGKLAYPARIVDHAQAAREAKRRIYAARRQAGFWETGQALARKHGSRRRPDRRPQPPRQMALDLGD